MEGKDAVDSGSETRGSTDSVDVETSQNSKWIVCKLCQSKVLRPESAQFIEKEVQVCCRYVFLPMM